jgi:hypothetical protein
MSPPRRRSSSARTTPRNKATPRRDFWDGAVADDEVVAHLRPADDPSAMIRSLGPPPLPGRETIAEHYFALAFDKASRRAFALAAANGLVDLSEIED